jgi:hypothetical protein
VYSPKVREDLIPRLYQLKVKLNRPMTHLVAEAVEAYLAHHEDQDQIPKIPSQKKETDPANQAPTSSRQPETFST